MKKKELGFTVVLMALAVLACNIQIGGPVTEVPVVLEVSATPNAVLPIDTPTLVSEPAAPSTDTPTLVPPPQDPLVLKATLCWQGPGPKYDVVSALKQNERVILLGQGSISGWYVIQNPTYKDPCWVAEGDLQIDAGTDLSNLKIFAPPPTATPTKPPPTPTPTPTSTPS